MIGDYRPAGTQREPGGRFEIGTNARYPNNVFMPADPRADQQTIFRRDIFQNFAELRLHSFGSKTHSVFSRSTNCVPCKAKTPNSARISCWRIRRCNARVVRSMGAASPLLGSITGFGCSDESSGGCIVHSTIADYGQEQVISRWGALVGWRACSSAPPVRVSPTRQRIAWPKGAVLTFRAEGWCFRLERVQ